MVLSAKLDASGYYSKSRCAVLGRPVLHLPPPCRCLRFPVASQATWEVSVVAIESPLSSGVDISVEALQCRYSSPELNLTQGSCVADNTASLHKKALLHLPTLVCGGRAIPTALHSACSSAFLFLHPFCSIGKFSLFCSVQESCPWSSGPFCWSRWVGFVVEHSRLALHTRLIWSLVVFISMIY